MDFFLGKASIFSFAIKMTHRYSWGLANIKMDGVLCVGNIHFRIGRSYCTQKNRKGNCKYKNGFFPYWKESILEFAVAIAPKKNRKGNCKYKNGFFPFWKESILEFACFFMSPQSDGN